MAAKDKDDKPKEFTSQDGKRYRRTVGKNNRIYYNVTDLNKKTTKAIDAKEYVREKSRHDAKERIRKVKEAAENKKKEAEDKRLAAILEAENKKRLEEYERVQAERARKNKERKRIKKEKETLEQATQLSNFLNDVSAENDMIAQMTNKMLDHYDESVRVSYWRGISKQFLRLSEDLTKLDRKLSDVYVKVSNKRIVTEQDIKEYETLVTGSDTLYKKFEGLIIEAETRKNAFLNKEAAKEKKRNKDKKRADRIDLVSKGRKKQEEKEKYNTRRSKIVAKRMERNLGRPEREKRRLNDKVLNELSEEKKRRFDKKERFDKFLNPELDKMHGSVRIPTKAVIGGLKIAGMAANAPFKALGIDFSDEIQTLSTLFSPMGALGKATGGVLKSGIQRFAGIDDKSMNSLDDFSDVSLKGKKKDLNIKKALKNFSKEKRNEILNKFGNVSNTNNSSVNKSSFISKIFNKNNSQSNSSVSQQSSVPNRPSVMGGIQSQVIDYNRSDDNDGNKGVNRTNELLEKILKALGGDDGKGKTKGKMFGGGMGGFGGLLKTAIPAFVAFETGAKAGEMLNSMMDTNSIINSSTKNTSEVLEKKLRDRGASEKDIRTIKMLSIREVEARNSNNQTEIKNIHSKRNELLNKFGLSKNISSVSNISNSPSSDTTSFRNSENNSTIKAEINKIEKINDVKQNPEKLAEDMKRFLEGVFIEKMSTAIATKMSQNKGSGSGSVQPGLSPF